MHSLIRQSAVFALAAVAGAVPAAAQMPVDDLRVRQLESEVMRLRRELDAQMRRIELLEQSARDALTMTPSPVPLPLPQVTPRSNSPAWLVAAGWDRIKTGMTAQEVIAILGRPTSSRYSDEGKLRLMFYAMEIGANAVLSGNIRIDDNGVAEINRPVLK